MKKKSETIELRDKIFNLITEKLSSYGFKQKNKSIVTFLDNFVLVLLFKTVRR